MIKHKQPIKVSLQHIPKPLKDKPNWVGWKTEKRNGRKTKVPYNPTTDRKASSTDPQTWVDFETAKSQPKYPIGFVLTDTSYAGIDLDGCRNPDTGELTTNAQKIVNLLNSYTEISPSGTGLHIIVKGELSGNRNRTGKIKELEELEMYDTGRYFTITGNRLEDTPEDIKERNDQLGKLYKKVFSDEGKSEEVPQGDGTGLDDDKIIKLAKSAKNSDKFKALWNGNIDKWIEIANPKDDSHSGADQALCSILVFYTGSNPKQIDRLFRQSDLVRDKWKNRPDYRERTTEKALSGIKEFYNPPSSKAPAEEEPPPSNPEKSDTWNKVSKEFADGNKKKARYTVAQALLNEREFVALSEGEKLLTYKENEGTFNDYGREFIETRVQNKLNSQLTTHDINEIIGHVKRSSYRRQRDFGPNNPSLICVKNGVLDLDKEKLYNHSSNYEFQRSLPVEYDPEATSEELDAFLQSTLREKDIPLIEEVAGFSLYREYFLRKAIMFIGEGGNGKTITLQLIENLLGHKNVAGWTLQELETNQYAKANLYKKYANIAGDLPGKRLQDTGIFKQLTGRDHITGDVKYAKRPIEFVNYAKLLFSTNNVPATPDDTEAFFDRWVLIEFPHKFVENPTGDNEKKKDPKILEKITTERAKSAFLNRAMSGLKRLRESGEFSFNKDTSQVRKQYERLSQPIKAFVDDHLIQDEDNFIPKDKVYNAYREYCEKNELPVKDKAVFSRRLGKHMKVSSGRHRINGKRKRCYQHIDLDRAPF